MNVGALAGSTLSPKADRRNLDNRMFGDATQVDAGLLEQLRKRFGGGTPTIVPDDDKGGGRKSRNAEAEAALREAEAVLDLIENLEHERALIGATAVERAKSNALRQAGTAATEEQRTKIVDLIDAIYRERDATREAEQATRELRDIGREAMGQFIDDMLAGRDATESLGNALKSIGSRLLNSGLDALFSGIFGGGGGGLLGGLFGKKDPWGSLRKLPGFAGGTNFAPGGMALVGEKGPELVNLPRGSQVMPASLTAPMLKRGFGGGGGGGPVNINVNVSGANGDQHVIDLVHQGVAKGIGEFSRSQVFKLGAARAAHDAKRTRAIR
jgi:hypothetical protein